MSAVRKYKNYAVNSNDNGNSNVQDKKAIDMYIKKISQQLEQDPEMKKKAALILHNMLNSQKKGSSN